MLKDICDGSQSNPRLNSREARYKICDCVKRNQEEWKGALISTQNMGKGLHKVFKVVVNYISHFYQLWVNLAQKFLISFQNLETLQKLLYYQRNVKKSWLKETLK